MGASPSYRQPKTLESECSLAFPASDSIDLSLDHLSNAKKALIYAESNRLRAVLAEIDANEAIIRGARQRIFFCKTLAAEYRAQAVHKLRLFSERMAQTTPSSHIKHEYISRDRSEHFQKSEFSVPNRSTFPQDVTDQHSHSPCTVADRSMQGTNDEEDVTPNLLMEYFGLQPRRHAIELPGSDSIFRRPDHSYRKKRNVSIDSQQTLLNHKLSTTSIESDRTLWNEGSDDNDAQDTKLKSGRKRVSSISGHKLLPTISQQNNDLVVMPLTIEYDDDFVIEGMIEDEVEDCAQASSACVTPTFAASEDAIEARDNKTNIGRFLSVPQSPRQPRPESQSETLAPPQVSHEARVALLAKVIRTAGIGRPKQKRSPLSTPPPYLVIPPRTSSLVGSNAAPLSRS